MFWNFLDFLLVVKSCLFAGQGFIHEYTTKHFAEVINTFGIDKKLNIFQLQRLLRALKELLAWAKARCYGGSTS